MPTGVTISGNEEHDAEEAAPADRPGAEKSEAEADDELDEDADDDVEEGRREAAELPREGCREEHDDAEAVATLTRRPRRPSSVTRERAR